MKELFKKILFGATLPQEYLCLNLNEFSNRLRMVIQNSAGEQIDITDHHLFNGYKPLIFSIDGNYFDKKYLDKDSSIRISFLDDQKEEIASLKLELIKEMKTDASTILIFQGKKGNHNFKNPFNKFLTETRYRLTSKRSNNVYLAGNLFDQIKIAYAIPRKIFLVSVGSQNLFNIFPTDLSGSLDKKIFVLSLRTGGKANEQIEKLNRCVISEMQTLSFNDVYKAGKNHMKELTEIENLDIKFVPERSVELNLPVPLMTSGYYELETLYKYSIGIHTLHFLKILNTVSLAESSSVLAHIHGDYGAWRMRKGIITNYLLRND